MNRRDTLKGLGLLVGGSLLPSSTLADFLQTATAIKEGKTDWKPQLLTGQQTALLPELVEVIIPATDTPGAKEALVHVFIDLFVNACYPKAQQTVFLKGLDDVDGVSQKQFGRAFLKLTKDERLSLLKQWEKESWEKDEALEQSFIKMLKQLTLMGFFSSKLGVTTATSYVRSPGPFEGCIDLKPGQKVEAMSLF
jgi:hypothetical protein